ncbi:hypothetical protein HDK64DRAFT_254862 [Phyllosticta capitalensis]
MCKHLESSSHYYLPSTPPINTSHQHLPSTPPIKTSHHTSFAQRCRQDALSHTSAKAQQGASPGVLALHALRRSQRTPYSEPLVYVLHEASPVDKAEREALAKELFDAILQDCCSVWNRIDFHFMRPGEETKDCIESHRAHAQAKPTDLARAVVPNYTDWYYRPSHSFIYVVFARDWKKEGLKGVIFDYDSSRPGIIREKHLVNDEIESTAYEYCAAWRWKEQYNEVYGAAHDAGMTDWQEVFKAANRLGMDQWLDTERESHLCSIMSFHSKGVSRFQQAPSHRLSEELSRTHVELSACRRQPKHRHLIPANTSTPRPNLSTILTASTGSHGRYDDQNDCPAVSVWRDSRRPSLPPLFSFQVYITYEVSATEESDLEALAKQLFEDIVLPLGHFAKRLDIHFMRPGATAANCMERHRALVQAEPDNLADVVIPSYTTKFDPYHSLIIVVDSPEWKDKRMTVVFFDPINPDAKFPVRQYEQSLEEMEMMFEELYSWLKWNEEYEVMFKKAQNIGMTEW